MGRSRDKASTTRRQTDRHPLRSLRTYMLDKGFHSLGVTPHNFRALVLGQPAFMAQLRPTDMGLARLRADDRLWRRGTALGDVGPVQKRCLAT
ncbi:hypothetical protein PJI17_16260 [Mycobacterium kansasii]